MIPGNFFFFFFFLDKLGIVGIMRMIRHEAQSNVDVDMSLNGQYWCSNFLTYFTYNLTYISITEYYSSIQLFKILNKQLNIFLYFCFLVFLSLRN